MSREQTDDQNVMGTTRDYQDIETIDSGIVTLQSCGTSPASESVLTDTMMDPGTMGADTSTPVQGQSHRFGPQNGIRPRLFGLDMSIRGLDKPPPSPISHPKADFSNRQFIWRRPRGPRRLDPGRPRLWPRKFLSSADWPVGTSTGLSLML